MVISAYRLLQKLAEGGMGTVWVAEHAVLGRRVAIKLIQPRYSCNEALVQRFFNEAKAAAAIADPGIVQVFDFGIHSDCSPYIVMELLEGETLEARVRRVGRIDPAEAVRFVRQIAMSLSIAHTRGVVHRDLKPENLFAVRDPAMPGGERVKVLDFGVAKLGDAPGKHKTQTGMVLGTPAYMSPEQCRGLGNIDHHADIYSLGAVLFCLVTGRPPFDGDGDGDAIISHVRDLPPVPSSIASEIPAWLDAAILRCLEKDPARRYQGMGELVTALDLGETKPRVRSTSSAMDGWLVASHAPGSQVVPTLLPHASTTISAAPGEVSFYRPAAAAGMHAMRSGRGVAFVGASAGVLVVGSVIAIAVTHRNGSHPVSPELAPAGASAPATPEDPAPASKVPPRTSGVVMQPSRAAVAEQRDPTAEIAARTRDVWTRFTTWARSHQGAPCPDITALDNSPPDPWGSAFRLTCTDQPVDQIIGLISAGPDGAPGTGDDIVSWKLGHDVTDLVRGSRWGVARDAPGPGEIVPRQTPDPVEARHSDGPRHGQIPRSDGIQLDSFGIPIIRKQ